MTDPTPYFLARIYRIYRQVGIVVFIKSKIRLVCYLAMTLDRFLFKVFNYSLLYDHTKNLS